MLSANRIQGPVDLAHNHEFVLRFTGTPKRSDSARKAAAARWGKK